MCATPHSFIGATLEMPSAVLYRKGNSLGKTSCRQLIVLKETIRTVQVSSSNLVPLPRYGNDILGTTLANEKKIPAPPTSLLSLSLPIWSLCRYSLPVRRRFITAEQTNQRPQRHHPVHKPLAVALEGIVLSVALVLNQFLLFLLQSGCSLSCSRPESVFFFKLERL